MLVVTAAPGKVRPAEIYVRPIIICIIKSERRKVRHWHWGRMNIRGIYNFLNGVDRWKWLGVVDCLWCLRTCEHVKADRLRLSAAIKRLRCGWPGYWLAIFSRLQAFEFCSIIVLQKFCFLIHYDMLDGWNNNYYCELLELIKSCSDSKIAFSARVGI